MVVSAGTHTHIIYPSYLARFPHNIYAAHPLITHVQAAVENCLGQQRRPQTLTVRSARRVPPKEQEGSASLVQVGLDPAYRYYRLCPALTYER